MMSDTFGLIRSEYLCNRAMCLGKQGLSTYPVLPICTLLLSRTIKQMQQPVGFITTALEKNSLLLKLVNFFSVEHGERREDVRFTILILIFMIRTILVISIENHFYSISTGTSNCSI